MKTLLITIAILLIAPLCPGQEITVARFGPEDAEEARAEGRDMAKFNYSPEMALQFLYLEGWDKYHHDRFFTRAFVQEGMAGFQAEKGQR